MPDHTVEWTQIGSGHLTGQQVRVADKDVIAEHRGYLTEFGAALRVFYHGELVQQATVTFEAEIQAVDPKLSIPRPLLREKCGVRFPSNYQPEYGGEPCQAGTPTRIEYTLYLIEPTVHSLGSFD